MPRRPADRTEAARPGIAKRSLTVAGHRTSISLEAPFWSALAEIAAHKRTSVAAIVATIDRTRPVGINLSAAVRVYVLDWYRGTAATGAIEPVRLPAAGRTRRQERG